MTSYEKINLTIAFIDEYKNLQNVDLVYKKESNSVKIIDNGEIVHFLPFPDIYYIHPTKLDEYNKVTNLIMRMRRVSQ